MITIIHGENITQSRNYYLEEKSKYPTSISFDGATLTITDLLQSLSGTDLFASSQIIFIDELFSKRKPSKELDAIIQTLTTSDHQQTTVYIWESKDLTSKQVSSFKNATVKQFKIPTTIFTFVDTVAPGNGKKLVQLFHDLLKTEDATFAFVMLQRQVRLLLGLVDANGDTISEVKRLAPWQKGKLQKQVKLFGQEQLISLHTKLYKLELGQKTGKLSLPLDQSLDFLLASL